MKDNCIVVLGIGFNFKVGLERIQNCINTYNINADYISFTEYPEWCVKHTEVPFAFKYYIIKHCFELGYKNVLYIDSSVYPKNNLDGIWNILNTYGYFLVNNYHTVGEYSHDKFLKLANISRDRSFEIKSIQGGYIGLSSLFPKSINFLNKMIEHSKNNISFIGSYDNKNNMCSKNPKVLGHRHDQSVASIVSLRCDLDKRFDNNVYFNIDRDTVKKNLSKTPWDYWWIKVNMSL